MRKRILEIIAREKAEVTKVTLQTNSWKEEFRHEHKEK